MATKIKEPKSCPECGATDNYFEYATIQQDKKTVWQEVTCAHCDVMWQLHFQCTKWEYL